MDGDICYTINTYDISNILDMETLCFRISMEYCWSIIQMEPKKLDESRETPTS